MILSARGIVLTATATSFDEQEESRRGTQKHNFMSGDLTTKGRIGTIDCHNVPIAVTDFRHAKSELGAGILAKVNLSVYFNEGSRIRLDGVTDSFSDTQRLAARASSREMASFPE